MFDSERALLAKWKDKQPVVAANGLAVPVYIDWEWGQMVLMLKQKDGGRYYVYRRSSVQGKYCVVKLECHEVLCTAQTLKGALRVCEELNFLSNMNG